MVAMNLKAETLTLMEKREALEAEMTAIIDLLCVPGGPGVSGNLIDTEGFPRSDIDIPAVRSQRSRLAGLRNDYKDITNKIDENLQLLHSVRNVKCELSRQIPETASSASMEFTAPQPLHVHQDSVAKVPFAMIDEISDDSPAAEDGLQLRDQILKFGNVELGDNLLSRFASEAQNNQGRPIPLLVMRQGTLIKLNVMPRPWHGRGLLGCHFRIL